MVRAPVRGAPVQRCRARKDYDTSIHFAFGTFTVAVVHQEPGSSK